MVIGMMVVGANAAFNDQADIKYTEAVDMLVGLGVIDGMGNNTFAPNGTLTRAQAAKMVAYVKAGANENTVSYYDGETKFTDVKANHNWAKGSINYCVANGIIAGMTATTYQPDATLTGAQLAKMLLVALGYPATSEKDTETLTGPNWQVNTMRKATEAGLFKGLDSSFAAVKAVTRQEASQIIYNALNAMTVKVGSWDMYGNPNYVLSDTSLLVACFDVQEVTGTVTGNQATGAKGTVLSSLSGLPSGSGLTTMTVEANTGLNLIGHKVTVLVKTDNKGMVQNKETKNYEVYGVIDEANLAVSYVASDKGLDEDLKAAGFAKNGSDYKGSVKISENYAAPGAANTTTKGDAIVAISNNDNGTVDTIYRVKSYVNQITKIVTKGTGADQVTTYTFASNNSGVNASTKTDDKLNVYAGVAANDFVIVTPVGTDFYNVEKVSTVNASVTGFTNVASNRTGVVANGTTYAPSGVVTTNKPANVTPFGSVAVGECVLLLDTNGKLIGTTNAKFVANYAYIAKTEDVTGTDDNGMGTTGAIKAMVYFADGTKGAYEVNTTDSDINGATSGTGITNAASITAGLYNVTVDGANKAVVKKISDTVGNVTAVTKGVSKTTASTLTYTDANTVAFFVNSTYGDPSFSVTVQTGTANISSATVAGSFYKTVGGTNYATVLLVNAAPADTKVDVVYYNGAYTQTTKDGVTTTTYTVYKDGVATTVSYEKVASVKTAAGFYKTGAADLELATEGTDKVYNEATVTAFVGGTLTTADGDYQVTDKTVVVSLVPEQSELTLADILAIAEVQTAGKVAVSYTVDPVSNVKTASVVYITAPATPV